LQQNQGLYQRFRESAPWIVAAVCEEFPMMRHAIGVLTYNLYLGFRSVVLGKEWERTQVQTVRWRLFQTAGKIVRHGRQTFLKINSAMLAVFTAIRERCARFMQEGCVTPETS
jgi:hypothetical protein